MKKVNLNQETLEKLIDCYFQDGYRFVNEEGGIILGERSGDEITVTSLIKMKNEHTKYFKFFAKRGFLKMLVWLFFKTKNKVQYIGDWHFHVSDNPAPSSEDISTMKKKTIIFRNNMLLLIIAQNITATMTQFSYQRRWRGFKDLVAYDTIPVRELL